ncbi:MAG: SDR family oxidoreductase [Bacilli bacterium]
MKLNLENKKILITGASKGIGKAIALGFAIENTDIVAIARTEELLKELENECLAKGAKSFAYHNVDLMEVNNYEFAEFLFCKYGHFDVIIHCMGGSLTSRDICGGYKDYEHALRFNALCGIDMNSFFIKKMLEDNKTARIIHISSISALALRGNPLYASAKAYLNAYVTSVGRQVAAKGIAINSVMPGAVAFEDSYWDSLIKEKAPKTTDFLTHHQAINRFGTTEEIANVVVFLASEKASFIVASNIPVDGGSM